MKKGMCFFVALIVLFASIGITEAGAEKITAFCGSASKPAMEEAARVFQSETGIKVGLNFSGSGTMLSQLKLSKRGDIYLPASPMYMDMAIKNGIIDPDTVKIVAYLVPVINVQKGNPKNIRTLSDLVRPDVTIGIGNPETVCVGLYAVEILERKGILNEVQKNIVTHAHSGSFAAALVVMRKVDAIIGWRVFSNWNPDKIETVFLQHDEIPRLAYFPAGIRRDSQNREEAGQFIDFLTSPVGKKIFGRWDYIATEQEAREYAPKAVIGGEYKLPPGYYTRTGK
ncbi:MAG: molybdate ABC transporter substrate-binding protein [Syntrophaceae bacterium]|nr:molybdate ABC transporter substrate-binding protein [Syntrophaceae bacterium]